MRFTIIPVPYEETTSYGKGTKNGPAAILKAMEQVEAFDHELLIDVTKQANIQTLRPIGIRPLGDKVRQIIKEDKIPIILGGEHSITPYVVQSMKEKYPDLSVLQLDAHADLRDSYQGRKDSHACVMRRVLEICPAVQIGIRNISEQGYNFAKQTGQLRKIFFQSRKPDLALLSDNVYITIDVDVFDPSVVSAVGTPEPGGMSWDEVVNLLKEVCAAKNVVGFDVVELSPRKGEIVSDFTVAKLIYKLIGLIS
ncbi:MAG: agmatinase [bacterium]